MLYTFQQCVGFFHVGVEAPADQTDDRVCVRGRQGHKESANTIERNPVVFLTFLPLSSFFSYYSACS